MLFLCTTGRIDELKITQELRVWFKIRKAFSYLFFDSIGDTKLSYVILTVIIRHTNCEH